MELKQIKELMATMERLKIKKLSIKETGGFELQLERESAPGSFAAEYHPQHSDEHALRFPSHSALPHRPAALEEPKKEQKVEGKYVTSPMVGTFYTSPSPDDPVFVKVGDRVEENSVVCIIEAMKVMNEVKAGTSGVIAEICIENGHPVEFGTKIFRIV